MPNSNSTRDGFVQDIFAAAKAHGEQSEADHEVGDLQQALHLCWMSMDQKRRASVAGHWLIQEMLEEWVPE